MSTGENVKLINTCSHVGHEWFYAERKREGALWQFEGTVVVYSMYAWLALKREKNSLPYSELCNFKKTAVVLKAVRRNQPCCRVSFQRQWCWTGPAAQRQECTAYKDKDLQHSLNFTSHGLKHVWWRNEKRAGPESSCSCCRSEHKAVSAQFVRPFSLYCTQRNPSLTHCKRLQ